MSQRAFATRLEQLGLDLDASAISRIEQGKRAVKLSEADIIADALDVDLSFMTQGEKTPPQELRSARRFAEQARRELAEPIQRFMISYGHVAELLRENPDLLPLVMDKTGSTISSADEYFPWVKGRISELREETLGGEHFDDIGSIYLDDEREVADLIDLLGHYARSLVILPKELEHYQGKRDDGERQEEG